MPVEIEFKAQRLLLGKFILEFHRLSSAVFLARSSFGADSDFVLLAFAVMIGQAEGRPMNATKLSAYAGIPRGTVIRKLSELERLGFVDRCSKRTYTIPIKFLNDPGVLANLRAMCDQLVRTGIKLSKMDNNPVAARVAGQVDDAQDDAPLRNSYR